MRAVIEFLSELLIILGALACLLSLLAMSITIIVEEIGLIPRRKEKLK
jgi:hypothetical protein